VVAGGVVAFLAIWGGLMPLPATRDGWNWGGAHLPDVQLRSGVPGRVAPRPRRHPGRAGGDRPVLVIAAWPSC